jgi:MscS family membrane protein
MTFARLFALTALLPATLGAQFLPRPSAPAARPDSAPTVVVDSASPRAAVLRYLNAARATDFASAATHLDLSYPEHAPRGEELARRLKAVLDSKLWLDIDRISPRAEGDTLDGLPRDRETLGSVPLDEGREVAIRLARMGQGDERRWVFSTATVAQIDAMYATLPDNWIREHLPAVLLRVGPFEILYWQWIALLVLLPLSAVIGWMLQRPVRSALRKVASKTDTEFDDRLIAAIKGPLVLLIGVAASRVLLRWIALATPAQIFMVELQGAIAIWAGFWIVLRAIGVLQDTIPLTEWGARHPALRSLIPLGGRISRLLIFVIAVLTVISQFGYPVATILAGLGIGGIAVALGAQKSLEHFFGSISIGVDQPFRVGDYVNAGGVEGTIESIGLRSTRIRTMDRTLISIPNGQLAESRTENFAERERIRLRAVVGLEYGTPAATVRIVRDGIEKVLRAHPKTWPDRVVVRFHNFGAYSLDIELFCWIETTVVDEFRAIREELFLQIMEVVEGNGASFAFPTQTIHMAGGGTELSPPAPPRGQPL